MRRRVLLVRGLGAQVLKVMAKKLVRKALEMLRKLATEEVEDEDEDAVSCLCRLISVAKLCVYLSTGAAFRQSV